MQKTFLKILSLSLIATLVVPIQAQSQDTEPDFKKEERFHRIYKKYNEQPTSAEAWEKVLSNRPANSYSVQNKDTLWDISSTLFGDSHYWPKVWSYNTDGILNPHEINPNQAIKFYAGTMLEAPTVGLADKNDAPEALPTHVLEKNEAGELEGVRIPPPKKRTPVVKKLPKSLPLYRWSVVNKPRVDFEVSGKRLTYKPTQKFLTTYVTDAPLPSAGEVIEGDRPLEASAADFQHVVVRLNDASSKYFVGIDDSVTISGAVGKGTVVQVQAEIEVMERVSSTDNLYRAKVRKTVNPLLTGAKLIPGTLNMFDTVSNGVSTAVQSTVIGGELERFSQKLFGTDNLIFLDAGAKEGLQEGSTLAIYRNERIYKPGTKAFINDRVIGQVKVVKLADHFATGYILNSSSEVTVGDYVGGANAAPKGSAADSTGGADDLAPPPAEEDDLQL